MSALTSQVLADQLLFALGDGHEHRTAQQCLAVGPQRRILTWFGKVAAEASHNVEHLFLCLEPEVALRHRSRLAAVGFHAVVVLSLLRNVPVSLERCFIGIDAGVSDGVCFHGVIPPPVLLQRLHLANPLVLGQLHGFHGRIVLKLLQPRKLCFLLVGHGRNALDRPLTR